MLLRCESLEPPMSQLGHSLQIRPRPLVHKCPLCINTDRKFWALGFVTIAQKATFALQQIFLFNHLVGAGEKRRRDREAEHPGSLRVDHQLELARLHHWQVYWFAPLRMRPA